ncbi:hypothetical protein GQ457_07G000980 [Hibiscus cannabinus]
MKCRQHELGLIGKLFAPLKLGRFSNTHFSWCIRRLLKFRTIAQSIFVNEKSGTLCKVRDIWDTIRVRSDKVAWQKLLRRDHLFFDCSYSKRI